MEETETERELRLAKAYRERYERIRKLEAEYKAAFAAVMLAIDGPEDVWEALTRNAKDAFATWQEAEHAAWVARDPSRAQYA